MKRSNFIKSSLGLAGCAACIIPGTQAFGNLAESTGQLTNPSCRDRVFQQSLGALFKGRYKGYLQMLRKLVERLGHDNTMAIWESAFKNYEDRFLAEILSSDWQDNTAGQVDYSDEVIEEHLETYFPQSIEGLSKQAARERVESTPPIPQMRQKYPSLNVWRNITAYEHHHLRFHGMALLFEAMIKLHNKEGELIAYDLLREPGLKGTTQREVSEFMTSMGSFLKPDQPTVFDAGLDVEFLNTSDKEVILQIKECEWARYFQDRHPSVGYLLACSTDETRARAANEKIRFQRTSTIMEGGKVCHFRYFSV